LAARVTLKPAPDPLATGTHYRIQVGRDCPPNGPWRAVLWAADDVERDEILRRLKASGDRRKPVVTPVPPPPEEDGYSAVGTLEIGRLDPRPHPRERSKHVVLENHRADADPIDLYKRAAAVFEDRQQQRRAAARLRAHGFRRGLARGQGTTTKQARDARLTMLREEQNDRDAQIEQNHAKWLKYCKTHADVPRSQKAFSEWLEKELLHPAAQTWRVHIRARDDRAAANGRPRLFKERSSK
jgi:hypothetical protein